MKIIHNLLSQSDLSPFRNTSFLIGYFIKVHFEFYPSTVKTSQTKLTFKTRIQISYQDSNPVAVVTKNDDIISLDLMTVTITITHQSITIVLAKHKDTIKGVKRKIIEREVTQ